jgi:mRNA interferase MazF
VRRGDIVIVAPPGDFGKPRPAVILQEEVLPDDELVTVALITSDLLRQPNLRISVEPSERNGLRRPSEVMIDVVQTFRKGRAGDVADCLEDDAMDRVKAALAVFLGLR